MGYRASIAQEADGLRTKVSPMVRGLPWLRIYFSVLLLLTCFVLGRLIVECGNTLGRGHSFGFMGRRLSDNGYSVR